MTEDKRYLHIALADDDEDDREVFEMAIKELNDSYQLTLLSDGTQLLEFLGRQLPDIIFLDLNMPRLKGTECLAIIRQNEHWKQLPVVILSTSNAKRDIDLCYELGANFYIVKPFSYLELAGIIRKVVENKLYLFEKPQRNQFIHRGNR